MALGDKLFTPDTLSELSQYLTQNGADPAKVANDLGIMNEKTTPGAIAQKRLDSLQNDPQWVHKFSNGDADAAAEFHRLTGLVAFQQQKDVQAKLDSAREASLKMLETKS